MPVTRSSRRLFLLRFAGAYSLLSTVRVMEGLSKQHYASVLSCGRRQEARCRVLYIPHVKLEGAYVSVRYAGVRAGVYSSLSITRQTGQSGGALEASWLHARQWSHRFGYSKFRFPLF